MGRVTKRINSTGRKRIPRKNVDIRILAYDEGQSPEVSVKLINLTEGEYPRNARIILEAIQRSVGMRFNCGTIGNPNIPSSIKLDRLDPGESFSFRLKVVEGDGTSGRMLGAASGIRAASQDDPDDEGTLTILHVVPRELGDEIWRVDLNPDSGPELALNKRIPGLKERLMKDSMLKGMVLPAALRLVLKGIWKDIASCEEGSWQNNWNIFCRSLGMEEFPSELPEDDLDSWMDDRVKMFCRKHGFVNLALQSLKE